MIYYVSSAGTIIGGTSATSPDQISGITHIPAGSDYAIYIDDDTVSSLNPNNLPGTLSITNIVASVVYTVPTATGILNFTETPMSEQLSNAQSTQISLIQASCQSTVAGQFKCKATGHTYASSVGGQVNFIAELPRFQYDPTLTTVSYDTIDAGWIEHTQQDIQNALVEGGRWKDAQYAQMNTLIQQVNTVAGLPNATVAQIQAIVFTEADYQGVNAS